jgi:hypothetical protein
LKNLFLTLSAFFFISTASTQIGPTKLYSDGNVSHWLHQLNDSLIYISNNEYTFESFYFLGVYEIRNDSIIINEYSPKKPPISIRKDTYYWKDNSIDSDSILIEYFRNDFIIGGWLQLDSLRFKINGETYLSEDGEHSSHGRSVIIPTPKEKNIKIDLILRDWNMSTFNVEINRDRKAVLMEEQYVTQLNNANSLIPIMPKFIYIKGRKHRFIMNKSSL